MPEIAGEFFDREADYDQWDRTRPHRHQSAAICFLTMRLNDSIPRSVILRWHQERIEYLQRMGVEVERNWKRGHEQLTAEQQAKFSKHFSRQRETTLDECLGGCELSDRRAREEVAKTLEFFHGQRYWMLSLIHISEPTRPERISYAVFCLNGFRSSLPTTGFPFLLKIRNIT